MNELRRLHNATLYSMAGFRAALREQQAFRTECVLLLAALPLAWWLATDVFRFAALIGAVLVLMTVELLNSAIEITVDRIGLEHHPLSGKAKDLGSSAVFVASALLVLVWLAVIIDRFA